ncbi:Tll0287-like domain-containing protein [Haliea sp. E17]|uniref:Tll0287-like domain-containing protein n=1 Tax=Haliea sp. E17 TaxID=3401576 RepID=UPI003AAC9A94
MQHARLLSLLIAALVAPAASVAGENPESEARALAAEFVATLKPQLKGALQSAGPAGAIAVCADIAPQIADALSASSGWQVRRVSLQVRNASRASPDPWERQVLEDFGRRQAQGETADTLYLGEETGGHYRYMQAQLVEPLCLVCHGAELSQPVRQALHEYYPDDTATGYSLGEVRGAISLSRPLATPP